MSLHRVVAGAAIVGAGVTLFGCGPGGEETTAKPAEPSPSPVQAAWDNHFGAFAAFNVNDIMKDYTDESMVSVINDHCPPTSDTTNKQAQGYAQYKGKAAIQGFFEALFAQLGGKADEFMSNTLSLVGPKGVPEKEEEWTGGEPVVLSGQKPDGNVFLTWQTKGLTGVNQLDYATDSFSFETKDNTAFILKQNIVTTEPGKTCVDKDVYADGEEPADDSALKAAWDNHFLAFDAGVAAKDDAERKPALDNIMKEYDDKSIVQIYRTTTRKMETYDTTEKIRTMFEELFKELYEADNPTLKVKLVKVEDKYQGVFLVWAHAKYPKATDTFVFTDDGKMIRRQNIVLTPASGLAETAVQI